MRIVILGGGPGGYEAALVAADHGVDVTVVSEEGLGGNTVLWDCVPSKALVVSSEARDWVGRAREHGVRWTGRTEIDASAHVDLGAVMDRIAALAGDQSADIGKKVERAGVRIVEGRGRLTGPRSLAVAHPDGTTSELTADVILLSTGSRPRLLDYAVPDGERVFTSRELFSLRELPRRLIVVGSGATGAEYASAFARFGCEVHLVSSRQQILPSEDPDAAAVIEDAFERRGMTIHRGCRAVDAARDADGVRVKGWQRSDDAEWWLEGSHVLWCVGQVPESEGLGLAEAGVEVADDGTIPVDGVSRTNIPTIYAAGDVTGGIMLASVAAMQGRNAMWHALGDAVAPLRTETISACVFTDPEVATVGMTAAQAEHAQVPVRTETLPLSGNPRAKMADITDGFVKVLAMRGSGTVLGGSVVAARASDLIHPLSVAVQNRLTVSQVAHAFSIYPSLSGSVQETARLLMSPDAP